MALAGDPAGPDCNCFACEVRQPPMGRKGARRLAAWLYALPLDHSPLRQRSRSASCSAAASPRTTSAATCWAEGALEQIPLGAPQEQVLISLGTPSTVATVSG